MNILVLAEQATTSGNWLSNLYADWKNLTFHEPAHYLFEFQNEAIVFGFGWLWHKRKVRQAKHEAIREHDDKYHPQSHPKGMM